MTDMKRLIIETLNANSNCCLDNDIEVQRVASALFEAITQGGEAQHTTEAQLIATEEQVLTFTYVCHLGKSTKEDDHDQRLAHDQHGNWYLFDWSSNSPATTDDGPCRYDLTRPISVGHDHSSVPVINRGNKVWVSVTNPGLLKFLKIVYAIEEVRGEFHKHAYRNSVPTLEFCENSQAIIELDNLLTEIAAQL